MCIDKVPVFFNFVGIIALPCSCLAIYYALTKIFDGKKSCRMQTMYLLLLPLLLPPFVAVWTPANTHVKNPYFYVYLSKTHDLARSCFQL